MKNSIKITIAIGFVAIAGFGVFANLGVNEMSNLALANIEALATSESDNKTYDCYKTVSMERPQNVTVDVIYCG